MRRKALLTFAGLFLLSLFFEMTAPPAYLRARPAFAEPLTCAAQPADMVAWWRAEGNYVDATGNGHDGNEFSNANFGTGQVGQGFALFDQRAVEVDDADQLDFGTDEDFSIEFWLEASGPLGIRKMPDELFDPVGYSLFITPGSALVFRLGDGTTTPGPVFTGPVFPDDGNLHHVAVTVDRDAADGVRIYLDNQVIVAGSAAAVGNISNDLNLLVIFEPLDGDAILDELAIYQRALGAAEVAAIYLAGTSGKCLGVETCAEQPADMVGWWRGEGDYVDATGNGHNGNATSNATFADAVVGDGFMLDGDKIVQVDDSDDLDFGTGEDFSLDFWFKSTGTGTHVKKHTGAPNGVGYAVVVRIGEPLRVILDDGSTLEGNTFGGGLYPDDGEFHFVAVTFDRDAEGGVKLYLDSELVSSASHTALGSMANSQPFQIGLTGLGGIVDEVELFNRALTQDEVRSIFLAGANGKCIGETGEARLELRKDLTPNNLPGAFNLTIEDEEEETVAAATNVGDNGTTDEQTVEPGVFTVSETAGAGTTLSNYVISIACRDEANEDAEVTATPAGTGAWTVEVSEGQDVVCTITNGIEIPTQCAGMTFDKYILGTEGNDTINGTGLRELIFGNAGNDTINGGAGNDCIVGGEGIDTLNGGAGNDRLLGDGGNDRLNGDSGTDLAVGGAGSDACTAESRDTSCES